MAQFRTATVAAALFCLFAVSLARAPPKIDESAAATVSQISFPFSDADLALRLPSEPVNTEADAKVTAEEDSNPAIVTTSVPMTELTFRPVNRHFHVRSKRPCRHHFKFYHTPRENEAIPYGNDMLLPTGENSDFEEPIVRGGGNRIPGRWMRLHHHHHLRRRRDEDTDSDSDNDEDVGRSRMKKVVLKRDIFDRFDREKKLKKLREQFRVQKEEEEKSKKTSFMKGVRKFLDHYI